MSLADIDFFRVQDYILNGCFNIDEIRELEKSLADMKARRIKDIHHFTNIGDHIEFFIDAKYGRGREYVLEGVVVDKGRKYITVREFDQHLKDYKGTWTINPLNITRFISSNIRKHNIVNK